MIETDTSPASVRHWDGFWRAREKGPLAAGGLLANVYRDIGYMYTRMQNYVPDEVFAWFDGISDELASYEGRMASMTRSTLDKSDISTVADRIARLGFTVQPPDVLSFSPWLRHPPAGASAI